MEEKLKELTPVEYGESAVKYLHHQSEAAGLRFRMHWHDRIELLWFVSGSLMLYTDEGHRQVFPGEVAVFGPGKLHGANFGTDDLEYHVIMFDLEKFCNKTPASHKYLLPVIKKEILYPCVVRDPELEAAIERLVKMLSGETVQHPLLEEAAVYEILGILAFYGKTNGKSPAKEGYFRDILEYIDSHFSEKISAAEISKRFGYNETYFCRRFREVTGLNFSKYLQATRMEHAMKLLRKGREDIRYIAWKCGYPDLSYFSNSFKKFTATVPRRSTGWRSPSAESRSTAGANIKK